MKRERTLQADPRALALAAGVTAAILFALCALGVFLAPERTTAVLGLLTHTDLRSIARPLTATSFLFGLVGWFVGTAAAFGFMAWLYNRIAAVAPGHEG